MRAELAAEAMRESDGPSSMEGFYDQYSPEALRAANSIGEALEVGNIDLGRRPHAMNDDGSVSTVRSMSFAEEEDGPEILIPTVSDDGYIMSDQEAIDTYRLTGRHMGIYPDVPTANAAAEEIHLDQEANMPETRSARASCTWTRSWTSSRTTPLVRRFAAGPTAQRPARR
jgi:hypothetical protein